MKKEIKVVEDDMKETTGKDLEKEVEKLKTENAALKKQIEQLNQAYMQERNALSLAIVKQAMKM